MGEQKKKSAATTASKRLVAPKPGEGGSEDGSPPAVASAAEAPFSERHPKAANAIFAAVCVYVAMLWLLALDQMFHWGLFGPKLPPLP